MSPIFTALETIKKISEKTRKYFAAPILIGSGCGSEMVLYIINAPNNAKIADNPRIPYSK
ncbi:hypothetical protein AHAT_33780 [Agarivorans sp. Toyoura001]|nr:hypothetical protein AHAT_33780 [Agarivorans sp. Toyoura001]